MAHSGDGLSEHTARYTGAIGSFLDTVVEPQEIEPTRTTGDVSREFKLVDATGAWIQCVALGTHAENNALAQNQKVIVYYAHGRMNQSGNVASLWLFSDSAVVSYGEGTGTTELRTPVTWTMDPSEALRAQENVR